MFRLTLSLTLAPVPGSKSLFEFRRVCNDRFDNDRALTYTDLVQSGRNSEIEDFRDWFAVDLIENQTSLNFQGLDLT